MVHLKVTKIIKCYIIQNKQIIIVLGLAELGTETIKVFVIPRVRMISDRLDSPEVTQNNVDRVSGNQIKHLLSVIFIIIINNS